MHFVRDVMNNLLCEICNHDQCPSPYMYDSAAELAKTCEYAEAMRLTDNASVCYR